MKNIINLTPHDVVVIDDSLDNGKLTFTPEYDSARVSTSVCLSADRLEGIKLYTVNFGDIVGLPDPTPGVFLIVSRMIASAVSTHREDLLLPSQLIRDDNGVTIGCKGFELAYKL